MTGPSLPVVINPGPRSVTIGTHRYPVVLPSRHDPRLHLAVVITTLQVLGQVALDFELSIAQILASILTCAVLEIVIVFRRHRIVAWPASAMLTGNGVAFVLRVNGTEHGDWWSTNGLVIFIGVAAFALATKYLVRVDGRHLFNPSNIGLVVCFLVLGSGRVNPLDLWWGPLSPALLIALLVIAAGAVMIVTRLRLLGVALGFWLTFAACVGVLALSGHGMTARWHVGPVEGWSYWWILVTSPEILVFCCFMITDPRTTPIGRATRVTFGAAVAVVAALLMAFQTTEFGVKVALLAALALVCVGRPWMERRAVASARDGDGGAVDEEHPSGHPHVVRSAGRRVGRMVGAGLGAVAVVVVLAAGGGEPATPAGRRTTVARPVIPGLIVPPVVVDTTNQVAAVADDQARVMARDVVADLQIQTDALRRGDRPLLATATDWSWGARLDRRIVRAGPRLEEPGWQVERITISTARRPHQGPPAILATLHGVRVPPGEQVQRPRTVAKTFEIAWNGQEYLLVSDELPPGWSPPS